MAGGFSTRNNEHLIRANLWTADLKQFFDDDLFGVRFVRMITDFPDGDTINIPSIGQFEVLNYAEDQAIKYSAAETGNFTFTVDKYKSSATYITEKMKQDSYVFGQLTAMFVPKQHRAIMASLENDIFAVGPDGQTASNLNLINGAAHRFVGNGTNETMALKDFQLANYALDMANIPQAGRVAVVDPSVGFQLSTLANLVNVSNNPRWEGIVRDGMTNGMQFLMNVYGFDVYISHFLKQGIAETIDGKTTTVAAANLFFGTEPDVLPYIGLIRQPPKVDSEYNKDFQREEYVTTARWGVKLWRPEAQVVILTDINQVA